MLTLPIIIGTLFSVLIGVALGMLGGGGSIMTVPILVYIMGLEAHEAIALSLLVVGTTSLTAIITHARAGRVQWKTGVVFGLNSMVGAYFAGKVAHSIPATVLLLLFGGMMLVTAVAMMRKKEGPAEPEVERREPALRDLPLAKIVAEGLAVGAVTGLVGAGGGFLVVPALVLLGKLPMRTAVGTSLLVIAMKSFAAFVGHASGTHIDWTIGAMVTAAAVVGSFAGGTLVARVPQDLLRRGFAWFVVVMAVFILSQEIPKALGTPVDLHTAWPIVLGLSAVPLVVAVVDLLRMSARAVVPAPAR